MGIYSIVYIVVFELAQYIWYHTFSVRGLIFLIFEKAHFDGNIQLHYTHKTGLLKQSFLYLWLLCTYLHFCQFVRVFIITLDIPITLIFHKYGLSIVKLFCNYDLSIRTFIYSPVYHSFYQYFRHCKYFHCFKLCRLSRPVRQLTNENLFDCIYCIWASAVYVISHIFS